MFGQNNISCYFVWLGLQINSEYFKDSKWISNIWLYAVYIPVHAYSKVTVHTSSRMCCLSKVFMNGIHYQMEYFSSQTKDFSKVTHLLYAKVHVHVYFVWLDQCLDKFKQQKTRKHMQLNDIWDQFVSLQCVLPLIQ